MSNKAKNFFIYDIIFSYIDERKKLDLIRYNRNLQKFFNIKLINYKIKSGRYKLGERNGKGKEYNIKGELIYEGEYLNGKGKEYNHDELEFEGEYKDGKKWNGKGYDRNGNMIYQLINGIGNIKEYDYDGILKYEGKYLNGVKNGKGKEYDYFGVKLKYEGEYLNGQRNGKGKEYNFKGKLEFEGEYLNGVKNGKGKEYVNFHNFCVFQRGTYSTFTLL